MALIFISHSSQNNDEALQIQKWLEEQGWGKGQIFLDLADLTTGDRWRERLNHIGATCEAVIVCLSDDWIRSPECVREFTHAESRGKPIFPVQISPIAEKVPGFVRELQIADARSDGHNGLERLKTGLLAARVGPEYFRWPPAGEEDRSPYRGLQPLTENDAAVFFGRDALITRGLDTLRRMRNGGAERVLVVLGASGAGKSSFLRAGLLSRLARDELAFSVLPLLRPEDSALTGEHGLCASVGLDIGPNVSIEAMKARVDELRLAANERAHAIAGTQFEPNPPTLILPIDQGEEFFGAANDEGEFALQSLCEVLKAEKSTIAVVTIRSDSYEKLLAELQRWNVEPVLFDLPLMSPGAFKEVIEGPGKLLDPPIKFEPELTDQLIHDLQSASALPLLALTLERLVDQWADDHLIEFKEYDVELGGLSGAIEGAVEAALSEAANRASLPDVPVNLEDLTRRLFIPWLVQLDGGAAAPKRRRTRRDHLPTDAQGLVDCFVDQRLLVTDEHTVDGTREVYVEVTHEAVLHHWPLLRRWLEVEASNLRLLDNIRSAALEWTSNECASDWLVHSGQRLASAESLLVNPQYSGALPSSCRDYVAACHNNQPTKDVEEFEKRMALLKQELGADIFDKIGKLDQMQRKVKNSAFLKTDAFSGEIKDDLQVRKNKLLNKPMWHPNPAENIGNAGAQGDYAEIWKFPCCGKAFAQDNEPSQDRADGCQPKPGAD